MHFRSSSLGYFHVFLASLLWSFIGPFSKICQGEGLNPLEVAFWRAIFGAVCFFAHLILTKEIRIQPKAALGLAAFGILGINLFFVVLQVSIERSGAALAMILMYTAPAWVAVFSRYFFKEEITSRKLTAIMLALAGATMICFSGGSLKSETSILGIFCGLASGFCYASHFPFFVWCKSKFSTSTIYAWMLLGGIVTLFPFVHFSSHYSLTAWAGLFALGAVTTYAAYLAYGASLKLISPVQVAVIGNLEPVLATLWVWLFWHENFSVIGWIGSALVLSAVFLLTIKVAPSLKKS